jgi:Heterokaryon incompatibility protein (HET)
MSAGTYHYHSLTGKAAFRVLVLLPGTGNDKLHCKIENYYGQPFEAVSWRWEHEAPSENAMILEDGNQYVFPVWPNLSAMLRNLRHATRPQTLWLDAFCVNQYNPQELSELVLVFPEIFSHALNVCIWLGRESDDTGSAFKLIKYCPLNLNEHGETTEQGDPQD